jgi:hypothetical protein
MTLLLYGHYDYIVPASGGLVHVQIGPFARLLRMKNSQLKEHLSWLAGQGYLLELVHYTGYCTFRVAQPRLPITPSVLRVEKLPEGMLEDLMEIHKEALDRMGSD